MGEIKVKSTLEVFEKKYVKRENSSTFEKSYIQLDRNENNFGFSSKVADAINKVIGECNVYTDASGEPLRSALSKYYNVDKENFLIGNGSFELISLIAQVFISHLNFSITAKPTFDWYRIATLLAGGQIIEVPLKNNYFPLEEILEKLNDSISVIWLCNPNNPTGTYFSHNNLSSFLDKVPKKTLVVLDEAYIDFVLGGENHSANLINNHSNLIILRTFSKIYGLASLRVGYAIGNSDIIAQLIRFKIPPNTNRLSLEAALASLADENFYKKTQSLYVIEREYIERELYLRNIESIPSVTNFIMINLNRDSDIVVNYFKEEGILVRGGKEYGYDNWIRLTIGKSQENELFFKVLDKLINENK